MSWITSLDGTFNETPIENVIALIIHEREVTVRMLGCPTGSRSNIASGDRMSGENFRP